MEARYSNPAGLQCIVHCRVSTTKQAYEGESLDTQAAICSKIAETRGWTLAHEPWREAFSGRKLQRPVFDDILAFLDARPGTVRYYLFRSIDRTTRGGSFSYELMKRALAERGVEMVDSLGIIQPVRNTLDHLGFEYAWSRVSPSEISELVQAALAKTEVSGILTRLIGQEISLRQRGYKIRPPADGFINQRIIVDGRKRTIEVPDPERAKYLRAMFDLRAAGQLSDVQICERVNAMGYRTREFKRWDREHKTIIGTGGGVPLNPDRLQLIVRRPIYCGIICEKWTHGRPVKAVYDGLVSIETFNRANRGSIAVVQDDDGQYHIVRDGSVGKWGQKQTIENPLFPYRKVVVCPMCRCQFMGSSPTGKAGVRYPTYHCNRGHKYLGVPKRTFEEAIEAHVSRLRFRVGLLPTVRKAVIRERDAAIAETDASAEAMEKSRQALELQKAGVVKAFKLASSSAMRRSLEADLEDLDRQIEEAARTHSATKVTLDDIDGYLTDAKSVMEHPGVLLISEANPTQRDALYGFFFETYPTWREISDGTPKCAWIFSLLSRSESEKLWSVPSPPPDWNTIERSILKWKLLAPTLFHLFRKGNRRKRP